jgi:hypothetical protein
MRKIMFAAVASSIILALAPATAFARGHHHRGHHRAHRTHARTRDEHFGGRNDENGVPNDSAQVASFNNGVLTLKLNDGSMVSGQVTGATEIKCEAAEPQEMEHSRHADGDHGGGSNGDGDQGGASNGDGDQGEDENGAPMCSTANLAPGTLVSDAELRVTGSGAIWKELELAEQNQ